MPFEFRYTACFKSRISDGSFPAEISLPGFNDLSIAELHSAPGEYEFTSRGHASLEDALDQGRKFGDLLLASGAVNHWGVDIGAETPTLQFGKTFKLQVEGASQKTLRADHLGLMAFETGSVTIAGIRATANVLTPLSLFQKRLLEMEERSPVLNDRQRNCALLINDSFFATRPEAVFVLLISAVEALCDPQDVGPEYTAAVDVLQKHLGGMSVSPEVRKTLSTTLGFAKRQSIRQAYMKKLRSLLGEVSAVAFDKLYKVRSAFVHEGKGRGEMNGKIGEARQLSIALFTADVDRR